MDESRRGQHRFQSFWHGDALSPYELFCLKSFVDCGHAVDLYSYDPNLAVPAGVRVRDAGELLGRDEVFVYQAEGFGKGSPSAFSNLFRYKLLLERGGWWIDTDVLCLAKDIPIVSEFFAYQDADLIACGTMYFEPRHPVMIQCLDQAMKLGRTVKWGDAGPCLLTKVLKERGLHHRAHPPSVCYPVHYTQALDALRPSRTAELSRQMEGALFLHLWHSTLEFHGVRKACLPPKRSLLREWADKHPVDGWTGEYDEQTLEQIVSMRAAIEGHLAENGRQRAELNAKAGEVARLQASLDRSQGRLEAMLASTSWRLTAPLRAGRRGLFTLRAFRKGN